MSDQSNTPEKNTWDFTPDNEGLIAIPVRIADQMEQTDEMIQRLQKEERDTARMVEEYESRYGGSIKYDNYQEASYVPFAPEDVRKKKSRGWWGRLRGASQMSMPNRHRYPSRSFGQEPSDHECTWAAIAHATAVLTIIMAMTGPTVVVPLLVPLAIYFYFRRKSEYVAFHALQAFTMQVVGTIGFMALLLGGTMALTLLIIISAITIIGIPIALLLALILVFFIPATFVLPLGMVVYGVIAAFATRSGRNYRYPWVADWVDDQLSNGMFGITL